MTARVTSISTLKLRVTRAQQALAEAKQVAKNTQDMVERRQRDLVEAMEALDSAKYGGEGVKR